MDLTNPIISAENRYKQMLEGYFASVYDEKRLPSHGITHHRRVWEYSRELILTLADNGKITDPHLPSSLIIACYLHDSGMSVDTGARHGYHSMELCRRFLSLNDLDESHFPGLLHAILDHDNKDYSEGDKPYLTEILATADDLDAFGFTGIYRYLEIYLLRGIEKEFIGPKVRENAAKRFEHFIKIFESCDEIVQKHIKRYKILDDFYINYHEQLMAGNRSSGYYSLVDALSWAITKNEDIMNLSDQNPDQVHRWFFEGLRSEMSGSMKNLKF